MDPLHDLTHSINIAPVDNTQLTHSEINIEVVSSSIAPASTPIPSPCESTSETEEFDDPYDFNIIIVEPGKGCGDGDATTFDQSVSYRGKRVDLKL